MVMPTTVSEVCNRLRRSARTAIVSKLVVAQWAYAGLGSALDANGRIAADPKFARVSEYGKSFFDLSEPATYLVLGAFVLATFAAVGILLARSART